MRNFKNLEIWKFGIQLTLKVYNLSETLPSEEKFGLRSQICRAAVSIPSNIAEGCSRSSELDYKRFLEIALGSAFELETQLIIIQHLKIAIQHKLEDALALLTREQKMINSLMTKLKSTRK